MLVSLAVRDFVLIDGLTLELGEGLNVLSGETGAGKSILVDALSLVLGGRARPDVVRTGRDAAEVEALFHLGGTPLIRARLLDEGLPVDDDELVVRRVVGAAGRSKAYVNGRLVTAAQLASLVKGLVDVSSQHESQSLCDASTHAELLDTYARLDADRDALSADFAAITALGRRIDEVAGKADALRAREDFLRFQLREIDELDVQVGEDRDLEQKRARLRHADRLASLTRGAAERLDDGDATLLDGLRRVAHEIESAAELDATLAHHVATVAAAISELSEVARSLGRYSGDVEHDPQRLAETEERLFKLQRLLRKHGATTDDLLARRAALAAELSTLDTVDETIGALVAERQAIIAVAIERARVLSDKRQMAARTLGESIARELASLAMGRARIVVDVAPTSAPIAAPMTVDSGSDEDTSTRADAREDGIVVAWGDGGRARLTRTGIDRVELMIAPNPGEEPRPLRRIASGGELSRALLAVKRVLATTATAGMYVFDEVDSGVGGAVAEAIGRKIADVARHHQVLCITHLPQIAAFAHVHFAVSKREHEGRTLSEVRRLDGKARVEELARMLGGATISAATRKAADEMIRGARGEARARAS